jgi:hypothetical protein
MIAFLNRPHGRGEASPTKWAPAHKLIENLLGNRRQRRGRGKTLSFSAA